MLSWVRLDRGVTEGKWRTMWSSVTVRTGTSASSVRAAPRDSTGTRQTPGPPPGAYPATVTDTRTSVTSTQVSECVQLSSEIKGSFILKRKRHRFQIGSQRIECNVHIA